MADEVAQANLAASMDGASDAPPPIDPEYLREADGWGLNESDLRSIPREVFGRMRSAAEQRVFEDVRRVRDSMQSQSVPQARQAEQPATASDFSFDPFELKFEDPEIAEGPLAKGLSEHHGWATKQLSKVNEALRGELQKANEAIASLRVHNDYSVLDRFIDKLGPDWVNEFGDGHTFDFEPESREFQKRGELMRAAITAMQIHEAHTGRRLSALKALPQALGYLYRQKLADQERAKSEAAKEKAQAGATERPRASGSTPPVTGIRGRAALLTAAGGGR